MWPKCARQLGMQKPGNIQSQREVWQHIRAGGACNKIGPPTSVLHFDSCSFWCQGLPHLVSKNGKQIIVAGRMPNFWLDPC